MAWQQSDQDFMKHALMLAERGLFSTSPNPSVGCVMVKNGEIIAEGWTQPAGGLHAEAMAIKETTAPLSGCDCYVTLEPCSHFGRTPPCADALIKADVRRVIVATEDPNPEVAGRGLEKMKQAGIKVEVGLLETEALELNRGFIKRMRTGLPFVTLKMGMSMDAKTAMASGESQWITGPAARQQVQKLRAQSSAVITGRQTVVSDNPSLNVRLEELPSKYQNRLLHQPLRVILDTRRSLSGVERIFSIDQNHLWVTGTNTNPEASDNSLAVSTNQDNKIDLKDLLKILAERGCNEVLVEAGAELSGAFVTADLVDEINLFMAPVLLGHQARALIELPGLEKLSDKKQYQFVSTTQVGQDLHMIFRRG